MKIKGFGAWPSSNISSGGHKNSYDPYNRSFKGGEFNAEYKNKYYPDSMGYMGRGNKEYNRYPPMKGMESENDEKQVGASSALSRLAIMRTKRFRVMQQAIALLVGSIIIVTSYQAMASKRQEPPSQDDSAAVAVTDNIDNSYPQDTETEATEDTTETSEATGETTPGGARSVQPGATEQSTSISWQWSEDGKSATLVVKDSSGNVINEVQANVTTTTVEATCTKSGTKTYTATAEYNGQTYTDTRTEELSALGHKFDKGKEVTLSDGSTAMEFECERCGEHFTIKNSLDEE